MAVLKKSKAKKPRKAKPADIELAPDAMKRSERAIGAMVPVRRKKAAKRNSLNPITAGWPMDRGPDSH